jgi:hypothetical protein
VYITVAWKSSHGSSSLAYWTYAQVTKKEVSPYSQNNLFFATYEWAQYIRELHYTRLEKLARDKHFRFERLSKDKHSVSLVPFASYEED